MWFEWSVHGIKQLLAQKSYFTVLQKDEYKLHLVYANPFPHK